VLARLAKESAQLRQDLGLVSGLGDAGRDLQAPPEAEQRARMGLHAAVREQRESRRRDSPSSGFLGTLPSFIARAGMASAALAVVAVLAIGVSAASGGPDLGRPVSSLLGSSSAEAATFEGVVADNSGGVLTVQTASSLETVQ